MRVPVAVALGLLLIPVAAGSEEPKANPHVEAILKQIAGKETRPAGEVFKNVQILKDVPAARFLRIMEMGYSKSLGVRCEHCHMEEQWDLDDKRPKLAARDMARMVTDLNAKLKKMEHLEVAGDATVNCTTCHRGQVKPATQMK